MDDLAIRKVYAKPGLRRIDLGIMGCVGKFEAISGLAALRQVGEVDLMILNKGERALGFSGWNAYYLA